MTSRFRRPLLAGVAVLVTLGLGAGVAVALTDALGIRSEAVDVPAESPRVAEPTVAVAPPRFTAIDAPESPRVGLALAELEAAVDEAAATDGTATLTVRHGEADGADDTYTLDGTVEALTIDAAGVAGAVRGVYDLAAAIRDGRDITARLGTTVTSRLPFRMVDLGAVGVAVDEAAYADGTDYSHNSRAFEGVILPDAPYIDEAALEAARAEFDEYVRHVLAEGATAIAIPGFIEYLEFDALGVYGDGDDHPARAAAMREAFGSMWRSAHDLGLQVFFRTDMLALTSPLERYLVDRFGALDTEDPAFWEVYASGLDELAAQMPYIDGVLIRIGEAGQVYDLPEWDYFSALEVTTVDAVRAMLTAFTERAETNGQEVVFRTWSVGVGAVGDMHTNAESYGAVLDGIDSPALIVSTKYTLGDFYSHLPFNDTLEIGQQRRIIEFQSRREFENFGAFPNDLGAQYSSALDRFLVANDRIEGVWVWTQDGGPWRAGPLSLELKAGFWHLAELNTELALRLARDPGIPPEQITADWARRWFSDDPATVTAIGEVMAASRSAISDGFYIGPFADRRVFAIGLEPPPMMWIFEWDILTGDSAVLDVIYQVSRDDLDRAIDEGRDALETVERMRTELAATDPTTWKAPELRAEFTAALEYQASTFAMLADYREMVLRHAQWLDTGAGDSYDAWAAARDAFAASSAAHLDAYEGDPYRPAFNLTAAELGMERADRDLPMAWAARVLLVLAGAWIAVGAVASVRRLRFPGARAAAAMWTAATRPWRAVDAVAGLPRTDRVLLVAVPAVALVASRGIHTWFLAPTHLLVTLGGWLLFALVAVLTARRAAWPVLAAIGGVAMLRVVLLMAVHAPTGPGGYWFGFWTDEVARSMYVTVAFALFAWLLVAAAWALAAVLGARRATGIVVAASGAVLVAIGGLLAAVGLETALTEWNDQMGLLPWGLSRILGITVYLEIPPETPLVVLAAGAIAALLGAVLAIPRRRAAASAAVS